MPTREEIEEIRTRVDILDVVSRYVTVRPSGKNYQAVCPFHPDESPSLTVSPEKGLYHCFGCGEGGDVFRFTMMIERIDFPEAVRRLAAEAGVTLRSAPARSEGHAALRALAERVARYYERCLRGPRGKRAWAYLTGRGLAPETIKRFRLGYAPPDAQHLLNELKGVTAQLMRLGLVREGDRGRWSFFRDRVIFPLTSTQGEVLGFAGRALSDDDPKYLNTRNTPIFTKSRLLYGLAQAREGFKDRGEALLVEGYTDVLMAHQFGFTHAVASMGTAFTAEQAHLLKRFVPHVLIAYDRDVAGRMATLRGMKQLLTAGLEVHVVLLPPGEDPDDLLRRGGREAFEAVLERVVPFPEFYVQALLEAHDARSLRGQEEMISATREFLAGLESAALRAHILKELSGTLDIPVEELLLAMKEMKRPSSAVTIGSIAPRGSWGVEEHLMCLLLQGEYPLERAMRELSPADFQRFSDAMEVLFALYREEGARGRQLLGEWLNRLDAEEQRELRALAMSERRDTDSEKAIAQLLTGQLRLSSLQRRMRALTREIQEAEKRRDHEGVQRLQREQQELSVERQRLLRELGWGAIVPQGGGRSDG